MTVMAQISLRVDDDVKRNGRKEHSPYIGLSMSTAINIFLKKGCTREKIGFLLSCLLILFTVRRIWMNLKDV